MNLKTGLVGLLMALGLSLWGCHDSTKDQAPPPDNTNGASTTQPSPAVENAPTSENAPAPAIETAPAPKEPTTSSKPAPASEPATPASGQAPAAASLAGVTFLSVQKREVGMTPSGVAMGNWSLRFMDKEVHWQHSDMVEVLTYTVALNGDIEAKRRFGPAGKPIVAKYDAQKKQIAWEGVAYQAK